MGVYIPNMEKPKSCFDCFAYDGEFMECRATGECVNETFYDKVRDDCPLIEIADEEMDGLINLYNICKGTSKIKSIQLKDIKPIVF